MPQIFDSGIEDMRVNADGTSDVDVEEKSKEEKAKEEKAKEQKAKEQKAKEEKTGLHSRKFLDSDESRSETLSHRSLSSSRNESEHSAESQDHTKKINNHQQFFYQSDNGRRTTGQSDAEEDFLHQSEDIHSTFANNSVQVSNSITADDSSEDEENFSPQILSELLYSVKAIILWVTEQVNEWLLLVNQWSYQPVKLSISWSFDSHSYANLHAFTYCMLIQWNTDFIKYNYSQTNLMW